MDLPLGNTQQMKPQYKPGAKFSGEFFGVKFDF